MTNKELANERSKKWYRENKERKKAYDKVYRAGRMELDIEYRKINKNKIDIRNKIYHLENHDKRIMQMRQWQSTPKGRYSQYKRSAKSKGTEFKLTFGQFVEYWNKPCHYCGLEIKEIGLDRVNNKIGYLFSNIVPCCEWCNKTKRHLDVDEFINRCKKVADYNLLKGEQYGGIKYI